MAHSAGSYPAYPYVSNDEALSQSIFVKDLPQDITVQRLADEFARFGPLRNGVRGVNLKVGQASEYRHSAWAS